MTGNLVDRIYEAAFLPDLWPDVAASRATSSMSGAIFTFTPNTPARGRATESVQQQFQEFIEANHWEASESIVRTCSIEPASFIRTEDFIPAHVLEQDPVRIKLRAYGIGAHAVSAFRLSVDEIVTFVFQRWLKDGLHSQSDLAALNVLRPHLSRAGMVATRLGLERALNSVAIMEKLGLPAAVLTARGRVLAANALLERSPMVFIARAHGALALPTPEANALLQLALTELPGKVNAIVRSIPLAATEDHPAMVIHVLPLRRAAHDIFAGGDVLVVATEVRFAENGPPVSLLIGLFDLTPAEARLASALTISKSLQAASAEQNIQTSTARSYLESIFRKTGVRRQSELVALLRGTQLLP